MLFTIQYFAKTNIPLDYEPEALEILKKKKKGEYVVLKGEVPSTTSTTSRDMHEIREMHNITLIQSPNIKTTKLSDITSFADEKAKINAVIANTTLKYTQSNSVSSAAGGQVLGVGAGQQSRIDCVNLVKRKTENWILRNHPKCLHLATSFKEHVKRSDKINIIMDYIKGTLLPDEELYSKLKIPMYPLLTEEEKEMFLNEYYKSNEGIVLASDAFFPFKDNIDIASTFGIKYIIQPGGSVADKTIVKTCEEYNIEMHMTGREMRMFLH